MTFPNNETDNYDVIIVGGGPVGLTLANLLGQRQIRTLLLEKEVALPDQPRAVALDDECLRIWQQCNLLNEILPFVAQGEDGDIVFTYKSANNRPIFQLTQKGRPYGYARGNVFLFHRTCQALKAGLDRFPAVDYREGTEATGFEQSATGVSVLSRNLQGSEKRFQGRYLVACDGGRSFIRNRLGIPLEGFAYQESWLIVDTWSAEAAAKQLDEGVVVWCDADCPTATIPLPGGYRRWEFLLRGPRDATPSGDYTDEQIRALIQQRKPLGDSRIERSLIHTYKARVAGRYQDGNIFLAGDAAHLSPPFAGQGLATGLRDVANLAWKLALTLQGKAPVQLLQSYQQERRPHQLKMLNLARRMGMMMMPKSHLHARLIQLLFRLAGKLPSVRRMMEIRGQGVTPVYADGRQKGKKGQLLLQPKLADGRLLDDLLGPDYSLICFGLSAEQVLATPEFKAWKEFQPHCLQLQPCGETAPAFAAFDRWMQGCAGRALLVRPDRFISHDAVVRMSDS